MVIDRRDGMVAEMIRRARPDVAVRDGSADVAVADLVRARISVDDHLDDVWHLIGMGPESVDAFEALRTALAVDIDHRFRRYVVEAAPSEQRRVVGSIDAAVSLAAVRSLRHERHETDEETTRILGDEIQRILATLARPVDRTSTASTLQGTG